MLGCISPSSTNESSHTETAIVIVTLPINVQSNEDDVVAEILRFCEVISCQKCPKSPSIFLVTVQNDEVARKIFIDTNGRITVDEAEWGIVPLSMIQKGAEVGEGPSPLRLSGRQPAATAQELRDIYDNYLFLNSLLSSEFGSVPNTDYQWLDTPSSASKAVLNTAQFNPLGAANLLRGSPSPIQSFDAQFTHPPPIPDTAQDSNGFLGLAPPYNYLPNTPYFRRARFVPPPMFNNEGLSTLQRIHNRYLTSMKEQDEKDRMNLEDWCYDMTSAVFSLAPGGSWEPLGHAVPPPVFHLQTNYHNNQSNDWTPWNADRS